MKKILLLMVILIFSNLYSKTSSSIEDKEMEKYYLKKEDFKYFEYDLSDCKVSPNSKSYILEIRKFNEMLYFNLNENNLPDGIWRREMVYSDESIIDKEECYSNGKLMKMFIYSYNVKTKERKLSTSIIYYPKKDFTYEVSYNIDKSDIKYIYFKKDRKDYFFTLSSKNKVSTKIGVGLVLEEDNQPWYSLYEFHKKDIQKIMEIN